jgi:hypothetical protein
MCLLLLQSFNNPFFSAEKSLVDCAYNLRAELENAAADVSGLFSKIGWGP